MATTTPTSKSNYYSALSVAGKICLVCGGTSGIGRAIALGLAQAGAVVVAGSTNAQKVAAIREELGAGNDAVQLDVSDEASAKSAIDYVAKKFGRIDCVVNAAGTFQSRTVFPGAKIPAQRLSPIGVAVLGKLLA